MLSDWMSVATWRWIANDDNCGICRMPFENCCTECSLPGDDCPLGKLTYLQKKEDQHEIYFKTQNFDCFSVGCVLALFSYALHCQVVELAAANTTVPYVPTELEVQR